ncbi:TolC family protein [Pontibacter sp. 13R65]|uniref:TolC family protein n=1 Tax=Pontibacter sp. 13R65 TaxID=3127458 RepID=UPI00301C726B
MRKISLAILLVLQGIFAFAQTDAALSPDWEKKLFNSEYALSILIDAALANAAELEHADAGKLMALEQKKIIKKRFYSGFALTSSYQYGTWNNFGWAGEPVNSFNAFNSPLRANYSLGFNVSLPLGELLSRHNTIKQQDLAIAQVEAGRKLTEREIRQRVITMYQSLVLAKAQLELHQQSFQSAVVSHELAEKQFKSGEIMIDVMSNVQQNYTNTAVALQSAKINYETNLLMMEETIGVRIIDLIQIK